MATKSGLVLDVGHLVFVASALVAASVCRTTSVVLMLAVPVGLLMPIVCLFYTSRR